MAPAATADDEDFVRQGCLKIPKQLRGAAAAAGCDGATRVRGVGTSHQADHKNAHRSVVLEEMLLDKGGARPTFDEIVALGSAKRSLNEAVVLPLVAPHVFSGARKPWRGVLLFGPPGGGKTMLATRAKISPVAFDVPANAAAYG